MESQSSENLLQKLIIEKDKSQKELTQTTLAKEKKEFEDKIKRWSSPLDSWSFNWRFCFGWVSPILSKAKRLGLSLDMLPKLPFEFQHVAYSNKIRFFFDKLSADFKKSGASGIPPKTFMLRVLIATYKYDLLLSLIFSCLLTLSEYSSSFFLFKILSIKEYYDPEDQLKMFSIFTGLLIFFKLFNCILNDNVYFMIVI